MADAIITTTIIGAHVATSATPKDNGKKLMYSPAYTNDKGEEKNARLTIPILVNIRNQKQPSNMQLTAWGKFADMCAKALSPGRTISVTLSPTQYETQYKQNGTAVLINGKPLNMTGHSYRLDKISFGAESANFIATDVASGKRGADWFKPGHVDAIALDARRKGINATVYAPGMTTFGYAQVAGTTQAPVQNQVSNQAPVQTTAAATGLAGFHLNNWQHYLLNN